MTNKEKIEQELQREIKGALANAPKNATILECQRLLQRTTNRVMSKYAYWSINSKSWVLNGEIETVEIAVPIRDVDRPWMNLAASDCRSCDFCFGALADAHRGSCPHCGRT